MLKVDNIHTHYGKIEALRGVTIDVNEGEIVSLIGANGAGKSTLLMSICGDPKPSAGKIIYQGEDITGKPTSQIMRSGIAIVPEGRRIFPGLTVAENLHMGGFFTAKAQFDETLEYVFSLFPRLKERESQRSGTMSGGEQQMLAIGRALMTQPKLLFLDEPSLGLAPIIINQIFEIIDQLRSRGMTIFLVEQNANQALKLADRGYVIENGEIVLQDTGANLLTNEEVRKAYLGG
ncbi:leucine/isoleucine/valine transporter subunit [Oleiphilus messinensis]|uniref:High-affinity branched-chain amino acid transport ATP-binding protein n=1 Tax=Oleiphilus messinensis TaxID=141451 RepID=A0A1Y0I5Q5_9GAMM|nr:ABC transporter ATP-binding protein [Oleiphilus messinensis]ARU55580.1 leucine/isoleucine/valine transporter subunit [Oleiphilus messinensis]